MTKEEMGKARREGSWSKRLKGEKRVESLLFMCWKIALAQGR